MTVNRISRMQMLRSVKDQEALRSNRAAAVEIRRLATELPPSARDTRKLFEEAARSLERRR